MASRMRKFSFSRTPSTPTSPRHPPPQYTADVVMTNTINKDYDPATGNKLINKYMIIREIGRGVHGKVKLAEDSETGELVAIKIVDKRNRRRQLGYSLLRGNSQQHVRGLDSLKKAADLPQYKENEQKIRREIAILKKCAHPHVVKLREVIDDPASRKIYMALEYMEGGEIEWRDEDEMPVLSVDEARSVFRDVVSGLDYLHYQGIIHRDIKPANLLLSSELIVKISDFGVSYFNELLAGDAAQSSNGSCSAIDRELAETAGTPAFFAPELCCAGDMPLSPTSEGFLVEDHKKDDNTDDDKDREEQLDASHNDSPGRQSQKSHQRPRITKAIDVWSLGVTLYCFIFGRCPFTAQTEFELFDTIPTEPLKFPDPAEIGFDVSDSLKDLLSRLLTKNPDDRITLEQVKHHPWVIEDLEDPQLWWEEADPKRYKTVEVTDEEVTHAVTIMDRLRKSIQKLSSSLSNLTHGLTRRRSKSVSAQTLHSAPSLNVAPRRAVQQHQQLEQQEQQHQQQQAQLRAQLQPHPDAVDPLLHGKPSYSTSLLPQQGYAPVPPHTLQHRPISCLSDETSYGHHYSYYDDEPHRPDLNRQASSASSSSGLAITIGRYRGGPTPKAPHKK
ncbi:kinase-like domain-containing protein [Syncephalastrum racemosum]|uniref:Kinase-like domain-containing protein n=1 Tax=Syncephalastrum racemosum TaxID=13706 RepID=A0A1X2H7N6_SYNRA|nr:kinase-like domain-containing protein [Syncephalastrum racemosum]